MGKTRAELLDGMDAEEMCYWEALYTSLEPLPEIRADIRAGTVASQSIAPHLKKGAKPPGPLDYFGWGKSGTRPRGRSDEELKALWEQAKKALTPRKRP